MELRKPRWLFSMLAKREPDDKHLPDTRRHLYSACNVPSANSFRVLQPKLFSFSSLQHFTHTFLATTSITLFPNFLFIQIILKNWIPTGGTFFNFFVWHHFRVQTLLLKYTISSEKLKWNKKWKHGNVFIFILLTACLQFLDRIFTIKREILFQDSH